MVGLWCVGRCQTFLLSIKPTLGIENFNEGVVALIVFG